MENEKKTGTKKANSGNREIDSLDAVEILQKRLDQQDYWLKHLNESIKKPKTWWKDSATLTSVIAIAISIFSVGYSMWINHDTEISNYKARAKEIVKRLSEIQLLYNNKSGPDLGYIQQATYAEVVNLVTEAMEISEIDEKYITGPEYSTIAAIATQVNLIPELKKAIDRGLRVARDYSSIFALRNYLAKYNYLIAKDIPEGRRTFMASIDTANARPAIGNMKIVNVATLYTHWCEHEYQSGNVKNADSLLQIAERQIVVCSDSAKYSRLPLIAQIKSDRAVLDGLAKPFQNATKP